MILIVRNFRISASRSRHTVRFAARQILKFVWLSDLTMISVGDFLDYFSARCTRRIHIHRHRVVKAHKRSDACRGW
jgi:hypothetical protein